MLNGALRLAVQSTAVDLHCVCYHHHQSITNNKERVHGVRRIRAPQRRRRPVTEGIAGCFSYRQRVRGPVYYLSNTARWGRATLLISKWKESWKPFEHGYAEATIQSYFRQEFEGTGLATKVHVANRKAWEYAQ